MNAHQRRVKDRQFVRAMRAWLKNARAMIESRKHRQEGSESNG